MRQADDPGTARLRVGVQGGGFHLVADGVVDEEKAPVTVAPIRPAEMMLTTS